MVMNGEMIDFTSRHLRLAAAFLLISLQTHEKAFK